MEGNDELRARLEWKTGPRPLEHERWLTRLAHASHPGVTAREQRGETWREVIARAASVEAMRWLLQNARFHLKERGSRGLRVTAHFQGVASQLESPKDVDVVLSHITEVMGVPFSPGIGAPLETVPAGSRPQRVPRSVPRMTPAPGPVDPFRALLGRWGASLKGEKLSSAVASAGLHPLISDHPYVRRMSWSLDRLKESLHNSKPGTHVDRWARGSDKDGRYTLEVLGWPKKPPIPAARLVDALSGAPGVKSVRFRSPKPPLPRAWDWPLEIGFFGDAASQALRAAVVKQHWGKFIRIVDAGRASAQIDLLLVPGDLDDARKLRPPLHLADVHTVVTVGGAGESGDPVAKLEAVRASVRAVAAVAADVEPGNENQWLDVMLNQLAHDLSLDEVLFFAAKVLTRSKPIILSGPGGIGAARVSSALHRFARRLEVAKPSEQFERLAAPRMFGSLGLAAKAAPQELAKHLMVGAELKLDWESEDHSATDALAVSEASAAQPDARFVQAKLSISDAAVERLQPGAVHRLDVRVARPDAGWAGAPVAFPTHLLPKDPEGHDLTLVFMAPGLLKKPLRQTLWLPPAADSSVCTFDLPVSKTAKRLDGRVTVLFRNRILQTLKVVAGVSEPLKIDLESVLTANLAGVSRGPGFDASFLFNDTDGHHGVTAFNDKEVAFIRVDQLDKLIGSLKVELERITKAPDKYASLGDEGTRVLIVTLARLGKGFANRLAELPGMDEVLLPGTAQRLQLVSVDPEKLVPFEVAYDAAMPKPTAELCAGWKEEDPAKASCATTCSDNPKVVCPLGFWGLRHVIERRLYDDKVSEEIMKHGADHAVSAEAGEQKKPLAPLRNLLLAAADKAENFDAASFNATVAEMAQHAAAGNIGLHRAATWGTWTKAVTDHKPELLLLLPHTEEVMGAEVLVIGTEELEADNIGTAHVSDPPSDLEPGPVVVLYGCRTALEEVPFSSFISGFRRAHASVVIATMSTVRGRHMIKLAKETLDLLTAQKAKVSVGELVRQLRRRLLARDLPMAMAVVAWGEIDWEVQ